MPSYFTNITRFASFLGPFNVFSSSPPSLQFHLHLHLHLHHRHLSLLFAILFLTFLTALFFNYSLPTVFVSFVHEGITLNSQLVSQTSSLHCLAMAISSSSFCSSSSSSSFERGYDVFLSFRGEDTRNNFTAHLCKELRSKGINTFIDDDKLGRGQVISPALVAAIENSMFSIVVLSENYASSGWCLEELVKILECKESRGQRVLPIFYNVDPSDVRKHMGKFGEALAKHEENFKENMGRVQIWRDALTQVANLSGWDSRNKNEVMLIEEIVSGILNDILHIPSSDAEDLVGIDSSICEMESLLCMESTDVRMIGIWGMGGIGKTTLAGAIYDRISNQFESCIFFENVGEDLKRQGIDGLQEKFLSKLLGCKNLSLTGRNLTKARFYSKKVLLVLDDVNDSIILEKLVPQCDWFSFGSRIIITTRNKDLLSMHGVKETYKVKKLEGNKAMKLFSRYAFKRDHPIEEFMELSKDVLVYTQGLPLALKVLGSLLFGRSKHEWEGELDKLKRIPNMEIQRVLQISYDCLNDNEKDIFLDIACFFLWEDNDYVTKILDSCNFFPTSGIKALINKSLMTISDNKLKMHALLQEMGREVVRKKSPKMPGKWSRLWNHEDISYVLKKNMGTEEVEGIFLNLSHLEEKLEFTTQAFARMNRLRLLKVYKDDISRTFQDTSKKANCEVHFSQDIKFHYDDLRLLYFHGYPLKSLPSDFNPKNLVDLSMPYSHVERLWEGIKVLEKLKFMNLSHSRYLRETPDFSGVINLEQLVLEGCTSLCEVHPSLVVLNKLNFLSLKNCIMLKSLPSNIYNLKSLETFDVSGCSDCVNLKWLKELCADKGTPSASHLMPRSSNSICFMFPPFPVFCSLTKLNLTNCFISDGANLGNLGFLSSLKSLNLSGNHFVTLPSSINQLSQLKWLGLENCKRLEALWELPSCIEEINAHNCTSLTTLSSGFKLKGDPLLPPLEPASPELESSFPELLKAAFSLVVPGRRIPDWIRNQDCGSEIELELPPSWFDSNVLALAFAVVYSFPLPLSHRSSGWVSADCNFYSHHSSWHYALYPQTTLRGGLDSDHLWLLCVPFPSSINFDEVIRIKASFDILLRIGVCAIKKCGIDLVYRNEEVNGDNITMIQYISPPPNSTLLLEEIDDGDSSGSGRSYDDTESENSHYYNSCDGETSGSEWCSDDSESENSDYYNSCVGETSESEWCSDDSESEIETVEMEL